MKIQKQHGKNTKGFYMALGICLLAVGVAAWTTYDSVVSFTAQEDSSSSQTEYQATEKTVSGVKEPASQPSYQAESQAVSKIPVVSEPESQPAPSFAPSEPAPEPEPEPEPAEPAAVTPQQPEEEEPPAPDTPDSLAYPIGKSVSETFSGDNPVYSETMMDWRVHSGVDIPAQPGETVAASCGGTVSSVTQDELYGGCVTVTQGELQVSYCGLDSIAVKQGDLVAQGQALGVLGSVPCESADGSHLHFAVKRSGKWIDPLELLE